MISTALSAIATDLVIVLFWVYFSALIFLLGAAYTRIHLQARCKPVVPRKSAVRVMQEFVRQSPSTASRAR